MTKTFGSACLVAGTAIGAGVIALPMVLAKIGITASILLMIFMWGIGYYTALVGVELNLRAGKGMTLGQLGRRFSGPLAQGIGTVCLMFLCYALLSAYINAAGSVLANFSNYLGYPLSQELWMVLVTVPIFVILTLGIHIAEHTNRILFSILFIGIMSVTLWLFSGINITFQVDIPNNIERLSAWTTALPVLFTSFGFHVIFHTLSNYLCMEKGPLRKTFWWGSLLPAGVYILWSLAVLFYLAQHDADFYGRIVSGQVSVGELIGTLGHHIQSPHLQPLVWGVTLFAILTSIIGVGLSLTEQLQERCHQSLMYIQSSFVTKIVVSIMAIAPAYIVAALIPGTFIKALGFAGMVLAVIAILLPLYLLYQSDKHAVSSHYDILNNKLLRRVVIGVGIIIIVAELWNMMIGG